MEEEKKKEMNQDNPEEKKEKGPRFGLPMLLVLAACLCVFSWIYWQRIGSNTTEPETQVTATEQAGQEKTPSVSTAKIHRSVKVEPKPGVDRPKAYSDYNITYEDPGCVKPEVFDFV